MFSFWNIKDRLLTLVIALADTRTPLAGRIFAIASIVYLVSPVDLLTDMLPLAGLIDDLILVPFGIWLSKQQIPDEVLHDAAEKAKGYSGKLNTLFYVIVAFVLFWVVLAGFLAYTLIRSMLA